MIELSVKNLEKQKDPISMRARIDTGPFCNYDCEFCYYKDHLSIRNSFDSFKQQIDIAESYGMSVVEFSGGESSVEPNWFKFLEYTQGKFEYTSCLTHGGKFADYNFLKKSYDLGLREILFSLHGYDKESHEAITGRAGSFEKILQAIKNAQQLGIRVRTNCTVCNHNYKGLDTKYADLINEINPFQSNMIVLNYFNMDHLKEENKIDYGEVAPYLKRYIDKVKPNIDYVNVLYIPFCYMVGYEEHVTDYFQLIYALEDWNMAFFSHANTPLFGRTPQEKHDESWQAATFHRTQSYKKPLECVKCKYFNICDGIEKKSDIGIYPIEGEKILDPLHYYRPNIVKNPH